MDFYLINKIWFNYAINKKVYMNSFLNNNFIKDYDNQHFLHPWEDCRTDNSEYKIITNSDGIYLFDENGKKYIDGPGGMWCVNLGYGRKEIAKEIAEQCEKLSYFSPWFATSEPSALLAKKISTLTPKDLNTVFFTTCGSTALDSAVRFVHYYFNSLNKGEKKTIIAREKGYHGSTLLSASISGKERDKRVLDTIVSGIKFLSDVNPNLRDKCSEEEWCHQKVSELENTILEIGPNKVAAFVAEPVLASGGVIIPPKGYHKKTYEICKKYNVLYISDEVVTAFGRLGHWFSSENVFDFTPDIITCAKGLTSGYIPMGATIISDSLIEDIKKSTYTNDLLFSNGFTYSGHPIASAAALKTIEIIEEEKILDHVRNVTPYFQYRLKKLGEKYDCIGDARGIGLLGCLEGYSNPSLDEKKRLEIDHHFGSLIDNAAEKRGLLVRPIINMCVFSPPLIISKSEIDLMFDILDDAVSEVEKNLK